jgi:hypothetical protein
LAQGKQAKIITDKQMRAVLAHLEGTRYPNPRQGHAPALC